MYSFEAFNDQQVDLAKIDRTYWKHRLIVELEIFAIHAVKFLEREEFEEAYYSYDNDSDNYEVTFESDRKLSDTEINTILNCVQYCSYSFNEEGH